MESPGRHTLPGAFLRRFIGLALAAFFQTALYLFPEYFSLFQLDYRANTNRLPIVLPPMVSFSR